MKNIFFFVIILNLITNFSLADEKKDCSVHKKLVDKIKCKTSGIVKPGSFLKKTINETVEYQKKAFEKKN